jgi:acylphosphatase
MTTSLVTKQVRIEGRVQGVWYRGWTVDQAKARGLSGWVRNRRDGSVEAVFRGAGPMVGEMVDLCWAGPPAARVTSVTEQSVTLPVDDGFIQLKTE